MSSLGCKPLCIVIRFLVFGPFEFFPLPFYEVSKQRDCPGVFLFDDIPDTKFDFEKFSRSSETLFSHFFSFISSCLMVPAINIPTFLLVSTL